MNKLNMESVDIVNENIEKIGELFPNAIVESENGKSIDFDLLKQELSKDIVEGSKEKYQLTWPGKKEAIINANIPSTNTLRPLRDKSVEFDTTQNIYIEGDNLEALKILQESYLNKIKCIYIDPPYNTGNDFIYNDNFNKNKEQELLESGQTDEDGNRLVVNNQSNGRYHSNWLSMIYSRIKTSRNLLKDDGVLFISIDDNEFSNLKRVCDEIFGENNFICNFIWKSKSGGANDSKNIAVDHEYILTYAKNISKCILFLDKESKSTTAYNNIDSDGRRYSLERLDKQSLGYLQSLDFPIISPDGIEYKVEHNDINNKVARWRWGKDTVVQRYDELVFKFPYVYTKNYEKEGNIPRSLLVDERFGRTRTGKTDLKKIFDNISIFDFPKPVNLLKFLFSISTTDNDIIMDYFSGSATSAQAILQLNSEDNLRRKFLIIQLPEKINNECYETICDIGEERIRRSGKKIKENTNAEIDYGFRVYKIDSSNMKDVFYKPNDVSQNQLRLFESNIKEDRTNDDLLTQVILDLGLTLDLKIEEKEINSNKVYYVDNNSLVACFDNNIDINVVDEIAKCNPLKVVFKDESFKLDNDKINLVEKFKKLSPETEISIL